MNSIDQCYHCYLPGQVFGVWTYQCRLRIYFPHPEVQTVIITDMKLLKTDRFAPYKIEKLVELVVNDFQLNPSSLVWLEHYSQKFKKPSWEDFSLVSFDWKTGKASDPEWISISEDLADAFAGDKLQPAIAPHQDIRTQ